MLRRRLSRATAYRWALTALPPLLLLLGPCQGSGGGMGY